MNPFPLPDTKHTCRHGNSHKILQMKSLFLILPQIKKKKKKKIDLGEAIPMRSALPTLLCFFYGQTT